LALSSCERSALSFAICVLELLHELSPACRDHEPPSDGEQRRREHAGDVERDGRERGHHHGAEAEREDVDA
jgi:hypothetical protein